MSNKSKRERLSDGESALRGIEPVGSASYEGGDGGEDTPWHSVYQAYPADGYDKHDVADACENHPGEGYILSVSMTDDEHDFVYVTVRTV